MSDDGREASGSLVVSGGSSTLVGTDTLLAQESAMRVLHTAALDWQAMLRRARDLTTSPAPAWTSADPGLDIFAAVVGIDAVEATSGALADALSAAAEGYGRAERQAENATRITAASIGWVLGRFPQLVALAAFSALPALTTGMVIWLFGQAFAADSRPTGGVWRRPPIPPRLTGIDSFRSVPAALPSAGAGSAARRSRPRGLHAGAATAAAAPAASGGGGFPFDPRLLTNPLVAALVRGAASSLDDVAVGALGLPLPAAVALGDDGAGLLGVGTSAAGLLAVARPHGLLRETAVTVATVAPVASGSAVVAVAGAAGPARTPEPVPASPPAGLADLASRIPDLSAQGGQVRIERYGDADAAAWVVYIGGTVEWGAVTATEPWDLTSNLTAVADQEAGSYRAVVQAMREAGIRPGEPVIEVGHSQGGLIAAQVAASGEFDSVATLTFGAPSGQVSVPSGVDALAVEHLDDIVPGMGGSEKSEARLLVRREVYASDPIPDDVALPAHSMATYTETARLIDTSPEPRLRAFREHLAGVVGTFDGTATLWRGTRSAAG